jgi:hypothetical protein
MQGGRKHFEVNMTIQAALLSLLLIISVSTVSHAAAPDGAAGSTAGSELSPKAADKSDLADAQVELKALKESLPLKKKELARLHHKWTVAKGRVPTPEEIKDFEKKRAKGKVSFDDNPYVNKKPLSSPGLARQAYFKKLEEVRRDEERVRRLEQEL